MTNKRNMSIRTRLALFIGLAILVVVVVGMSLGYLWGYDLLRTTIGRQYSDTAEMLSTSISKSIDDEIMHIEDHVKDSCYMEVIEKANLRYQDMEKASVQKYLLGMDARWVDAGADDALTKEYLITKSSQKLKMHVEREKYVAEMLITDKVGGLVAASGKTTDFYQGDEEWWQRGFVCEEGNIYLGDVEFDESANTWSVPLAIPIRENNGEVVGVCKAAVNVETFWQSVDDYRICENGHAALVNGKGDVLYHHSIQPFSVKLFKDEDLKAVLQGKRKWLELTDIHGEEAVISWSRVKHPLLFKYGIVWIVAVDANRAEVFAPLNKLLQQGGIVLSILAALLIFLTYVSSGIFAKPIRSLHHAIEQVGKGDLYCRVAMDTNDEIGELSEAFDQMTRNLRESTTSIANLNREMAERQKVEEALRQNQEKFKSLFDYTNDAIFIAEVETRKLVDCNRTAQELIGYPKERILSMYADQLHPEDRIEETMAGFRKQAAGEIEYVESEILTKDQKRIPVSISSAPVVVGGKTFLQGIFRDVTEQRQAGAALRKAKQEAEAASRAKGEFLANVSHEIRTPMNAIIGMTELTLSTNLTKEQREYVETIKMSSESLLGLLNDVLDLSKIEAHQMDLEEVNFDLRTTVESVAETLAVKAEETGLEFTCHIKPDVPTALVGDPLRLGQILVNLCGNAIKFTEAGEVVIHVETEKGGDDSVVLHFTVSDTGIGIPRDKVETIFESFRQADGSTTRKYGGTGLGLAVCKELVGKMGGNIWVESPANCQMPNAKCQMQGEEREQAPQSKIQNPKSKIPGPGSTFHFTAHFGLNHAKIKEDRLPDRLDLAGMPVLIVDDNATNRLVLREITSAWGLLPAEAVDGNEALVKMKKAFESGNPYRLLLIDVQMPGMDGFELTKRVKESPYGTDAEIILLTSLGQKVGAARCKELGISGYLVKPVKQSELLDAVMMALGESPVEEDSVIARSTIHPANRRLNILLAEDNLVNQKVAVAMLKKRGHRIVTVLNGKAAVEQLDKDQFDLILMDVQMPEMDGIAATREIRNSKSDIRELPIVAMTANAMKGDQEDYLRAGMNDYISKPIKPEELFRVVESWGDRQHGKKEEKLSVVLENQEQQARNVFDLTKALEVTAGDTGLFQEIANLFIEGLPGNIAQIREGISRGDSAAVERGAHSLKGSVSNFGAERAFKAAYDLELVGRKAKLSEAEVTFLELNSALKELEGAIRQSLLEMEHESSNR